MRSRILVAAAALSGLLGGCIDAPEYFDFDLEVTPFSNPFLTVPATQEVHLIRGYTCPDTGTARLRLLYADDTPQDGTAPLALLLHDENFDYIDSTGGHYANPDDHLSIAWAEEELTRTWGTVNVSGPPSGTLVASLLEAGWFILAPTGCWGDAFLGTSQNNYGEGFTRIGRYFADDALEWVVSNRAIDASRIAVVGIGDGGKGAVGLLRESPRPAMLVLDSAPDYLVDIFDNADYAPWMRGMGRIYGLDFDEPEQKAELRTAVQQDSLRFFLNNQGLRLPTAFVYSSNDPRVPFATTNPTAQAIANRLPEADRFVRDLEANQHGFINRDRTLSDELVQWMGDRLPAAQ